MIIPREYDTPESGSSADTFEFPPDIPDGITVGDLASHISNVVENIHLHPPSKVEQRLRDTDQLCLKAHDRPFDPPKLTKIAICCNMSFVNTGEWEGEVYLTPNLLGYLNARV
ncbi:hypothetical protein SprV_0100198200 [Sparganum proliferum]